jgi:hypothetical protein
LNWLSENGLSLDTCGRLDDAQGGQQLGHGLRSHRRPTIGVNRELALNNILFDARLADQPLDQLTAFLLRQRPAHHVAAEDVLKGIQSIAASGPNR